MGEPKRCQATTTWSEEHGSYTSRCERERGHADEHSTAMNRTWNRTWPVSPEEPPRPQDEPKIFDLMQGLKDSLARPAAPLVAEGEAPSDLMPLVDDYVDSIAEYQMPHETRALREKLKDGLSRLTRERDEAISYFDLEHETSGIHLRDKVKLIEEVAALRSKLEAAHLTLQRIPEGDWP